MSGLNSNSKDNPSKARGSAGGQVRPYVALPVVFNTSALPPNIVHLEQQSYPKFFSHSLGLDCTNFCVNNLQFCNPQWIENYLNFLQQHKVHNPYELGHNKVAPVGAPNVNMLNSSSSTLPPLPLLTNLTLDNTKTIVNPDFHPSINSPITTGANNVHQINPSNGISCNKTTFLSDSHDVGSQIIGETSSQMTLSSRSKDRNSSAAPKGRSCGVCGKSFKYPSDLKKHLLTHDAPREYVCEVCDKPFRREHQLIVHRRIHTGEKPFICNYCGARFRHDSTFSLHVRAKHDNIKPFFCDRCNKTFGRISHLKKHQNNSCKAIQRSLSPTVAKTDNNGIVMETCLGDGNSLVHLPTTTNASHCASERGTPSPLSTENTKKPIIIRCQYCYKDFGKTLELRRHLNSAGKCNVLYLMDLKRKENKFNSVEFSKSTVSPPVSIENLIPRNQTIELDICAPVIVDADTQLGSFNNSLPPSQPAAVNSSLGVELDLMESAADTIRTNSENNTDPDTHIPYDPFLNIPSCFTGNSGSTIPISTVLFENIMPNSTFFDDQVFDLFKDNNFQNSPEPPPPSNM